jgi:hypothetical protein
MKKKLNITLEHNLNQKLRSKFCLWNNAHKHNDAKKFWGYTRLT